jgi:thiol-disulfide isomerase/thioredoxin
MKMYRRLHVLLSLPLAVKRVALPIGFLLLLGANADAADTNVLASAASAESEQKVAFSEAMKVFMPAMDAQDNRGKVDFKTLRRVMNDFWGKYPELHPSQTLLTYYMDMFAKEHPEAALAEWASFTNAPSSLAAALAQGKLRYFELIKQPLELKFKALDGRTVDLASWRGKVVLIDFWATWCTPCVAELPVLKKAYAKFHEQGFEVIGISLDRMEDKEKLLRLIADRELPWPQHFDGKLWQNEIAQHYAINSLPTTFLLDKEGRLAATGLKGDQLMAEVQRLLAR